MQPKTSSPLSGQGFVMSQVVQKQPPFRKQPKPQPKQAQPSQLRAESEQTSLRLIFGERQLDTSNENLTSCKKEIQKSTCWL